MENKKNAWEIHVYTGPSSDRMYRFRHVKRCANFTTALAWTKYLERLWKPRFPYPDSEKRIRHSGYVTLENGAECWLNMELYQVGAQP